MEDLGCWKDKGHGRRAIRMLEGLLPTLEDDYIEREDAKNICIQAALSLGNTRLSLDCLACRV